MVVLNDFMKIIREIYDMNMEIMGLDTWPSQCDAPVQTIRLSIAML